MKLPHRIAVLAASAFLAAIVLGAAGCNKSEQNQSTQTAKYTCSMHPDVVQEKAGKCPKCGMDLTEKH